MLREIHAAEVHSLLLSPYQFGECIDLQNHSIRGVLEISDSKICGVDFSGCIFNDHIDISNSVFQGLSWFKNVAFRSTVSFHRMQFSSDARFDSAGFYDGANFSKAAFCGVGCFDGVVAHKLVSMEESIAYGNLSLSNCDFQHALLLNNATLMGGLWMPGTNVEQLINMDTCTVLGRVQNDSVALKEIARE